MIDKRNIQAACDDIVREFAPLQVILFGSYAYGTPTETSDVDLLVVVPTARSERHRRIVETAQRNPSNFSIDLLVRSPEEIAYRLSHNDGFLREITEKGEILYEVADFFIDIPETEETAMNPLTLEWMEKAEKDYAAVQWLQQAPIPDYDIICFHIQQCIEKYLKAWLQAANLLIPRSHDLKELLALIVPTVPMWQTWEPDFSEISKYAVATRYPGDSATADNAMHAMQICDQVRHAIREQLKLPLDVTVGETQ